MKQLQVNGTCPMCADKVAAAIHQDTDITRIQQDPDQKMGTLLRGIPAKEC